MKAGSMSTKAPRLITVMNDGACVGFPISLGPHGIEAFDKNERSLVVFDSRSMQRMQWNARRDRRAPGAGNRPG
jgi:hypothetical protein